MSPVAQGDPLGEIWKLVIAGLKFRSTQMLMRQQTYLAELTRGEARVLVTAQWLGSIQVRMQDVERSFAEVCGSDIRLKFEPVFCVQSQEEQPTLGLPLSPPEHGMGVESMAHRAAKELLARWITDRTKAARKSGHLTVTISPINWPALAEIQLDPVLQVGEISCSPDVLVSTPYKAIALEVIHANELSDRKRNAYISAGISCYEISATWILNQVCMPTKLEFIGS
jgi:hypothetical protein